MGKVYSLTVAAMVGFGLMFASCANHSAGHEASELSFDSLVVDTATQVINGADTLKATVHIQLMLAKGDGAVTVNDSILNSGILLADLMPKDTAGMNVEQKVRAFAKNFLDSYRADYEEMKKEGSVSESFQYSYDVTAKVEDNETDSIVNYELGGYMFTGGAHGQSFSKAYNFNKSTGANISKADLLKADAEKPVASLICGDMQRQLGVKSDEELKSMGVFYGMDAYVPDNFIVKLDSITFIYMSDEIAPHAVGEIRATLSKQALAKYLKK